MGSNTRRASGSMISRRELIRKSTVLGGLLALPAPSRLDAMPQAPVAAAKTEKEAVAA